MTISKLKALQEQHGRIVDEIDRHRTAYREATERGDRVALQYIEEKFGIKVGSVVKLKHRGKDVVLKITAISEPGHLTEPVVFPTVRGLQKLKNGTWSEFARTFHSYSWGSDNSRAPEVIEP